MASDNSTHITKPNTLVMVNGCLYKYKSLSDDKFIQVFEIIRDCSLYFARPTQFEDKFELKPVVTVGDLSDVSYKKSVEEWVAKVLKLNSPGITDIEISNELNALTQKGLEEFANKFEPGYSEQIRSEYRILSLGDVDNNHHLWLHYADNFSGICFGLHIDETILPLYRVEYSHHPPSFDVASRQEFEILKASVLTKSEEWRAESEVRGVLRIPPLSEGPTLCNQRLIIPRHRFIAIYIGFRVPPKTRERIIKLIRRYFPLIKIFEVRGGIPFLEIQMREVAHPPRLSKSL